MGDVVSIEVDGELGPPPLDDDRRPPRLGMPLALVVVVVLLGALVWSSTRSGAEHEAEAPSATPPTTAPSSAPTTTAAPATTSTVRAPGPIESARMALVAWGRFAGSGDLRELDGYLAPDGEQYEQLRTEAGSIRAGESYRVLLENASVSDSGSGITTVTGDVVWARPDQPDQRFRWAIDLRCEAAACLLVTVRTAT